MRAMTKEEYKAQCDAHNKDYQAALQATAEKYAMGNRSFKIGDIVRDANNGSVILVDSIKVTRITTYPQCVYRGFEFTKAGEYRKDKRRYAVWENDALIHTFPAGKSVAP